MTHIYYYKTLKSKYFLHKRARDFNFLDVVGSSASVIMAFFASSISLFSLSKAELAAATSIFRLVVGVRGAAETIRNKKISKFYMSDGKKRAESATH